MTATPLARRAAALLGGVLATALSTLAGGVGATVPAAADAATVAPHLTNLQPGPGCQAEKFRTPRNQPARACIS